MPGLNQHARHEIALPADRLVDECVGRTETGLSSSFRADRRSGNPNGAVLQSYSIRRPDIALAITSCWISLVPSKIVWILASRCQRSTGYSRVYP